jgi:hypothetical protein
VQNFVFELPTRVIFGKGNIGKTGREVKAFGSKALMVYGSGSIKKNGIYDQVIESLKEAGVSIIELPGVKSNPVLSLVYKGIETGRKECWVEQFSCRQQRFTHQFRARANRKDPLLNIRNAGVGSLWVYFIGKLRRINAALLYDVKNTAKPNHLRNGCLVIGRTTLMLIADSRMRSIGRLSFLSSIIFQQSII